eukprot:m.51634 g.51634  ORF g.51634 m.51634 type:complete len:95 (+) comp7573_c0_seq2:45-329(+)
MLRLHGNIRQRFPQWLSNPFLAFSTVSSGIDERARVVVLAGATAIGKTELSLQLAERINGEIISADSVQVCVSLLCAPSSPQFPFPIYTHVPYC